MDGALDHLAFHRRSGHALILHYADIIANSAREVARIADYLSIRLSPTVTGDITEEMSLPRMRAKVPPSDGSENARHLIRHETTLYDPETLLNVGHMMCAPGAADARLTQVNWHR